MGMQFVQFISVGFSYPQQTQHLFNSLTTSFPTGWTAFLGANGAGKTTLLQLAVGMLQPVSGTVDFPEPTGYAAQRTDEPPSSYEDFALAYDRNACRLHGQLLLERDWIYRWDSLSHGERKRAQLAYALWQEPQVLAVDEPTNHLDTPAIQLITEALHNYKGIGLLVSHDRALVNALCTRTAIIHAPHVRLLDCPPSVALHEMRMVANSARQAKYQEKQQLQQISNEINKRLTKASKQNKLCSKRNLSAKDHDAKAHIDLVRITGADGKAGKLKRQLEHRMEMQQDLMDTVCEDFMVAQSLDLQKPIAGMTIQSILLKRDFIVRLPQGSIALGPQKRLSHGFLEIVPHDRIGITGANGSGKTTLMRIISQMALAENIPFVYIPQELDSTSCMECIHELDALDSESKGRVISGLVRLGSDPELIRASAMASPGEAKKLMFSLLFEHPVAVLMLDEPTNHLDLPARMALEKALQDYAGALICISHDQTFLQTLCSVGWHIDENQMLCKR
jgi:macrolide transport system ATP-binding/permease protein